MPRLKHTHISHLEQGAPIAYDINLINALLWDPFSSQKKLTGIIKAPMPV